MAIVDVMVALCYDRPYKKGWPLVEALEYLRKQSGTQFSPDLVKEFINFAMYDKCITSIFSEGSLGAMATFNGENAVKKLSA